MQPAAFRQTFRILRRRFPAENWALGRDPFEVLVAIVVSQNSTDAVTERVMARLRDTMNVTPTAVAGAPARRLVRVLRPAGLSEQKVPRIQAAAARIARDLDGDLTRLLRLPTADARSWLIGLPGVGPKTADVWLSLVGGRETMPVDTHIARLARRWRLAAGDYERVTRALQSAIPPKERRLGHLTLIRFGREVCQARRPRCDVCPVYDLCDANEKRLRRG